MSTKKPQKKTGRKLIKIDETEVLKLARLGCKNTEIADFFDCSADTIERRFAGILKKGRAGRKAKLRELQWRSAEAGIYAMQIWLGKQELGQTDKQDVNHTGNIAVTNGIGVDTEKL